METSETWRDLLSSPYIKNQRQMCIRASKGNADFYSIFIKLVRIN